MLLFYLMTLWSKGDVLHCGAQSAHDDGLPETVAVTGPRSRSLGKSAKTDPFAVKRAIDEIGAGVFCWWGPVGFILALNPATLGVAISSSTPIRRV